MGQRQDRATPGQVRDRTGWRQDGKAPGQVRDRTGRRQDRTVLGQDGDRTGGRRVGSDSADQGPTAPTLQAAAQVNSAFLSAYTQVPQAVQTGKRAKGTPRSMVSQLDPQKHRPVPRHCPARATALFNYIFLFPKIFQTRANLFQLQTPLSCCTLSPDIAKTC